MILGTVQHTHRMRAKRGFTLVTSVVLTSVVLSVGIALLDVAYKQTILASSAKNSQFAFYASDMAMECALYYDQKLLAFDYNGLPSNTITCNTQNIDLTAAPNSSVVNGSTRTTIFAIPCATGGGTQASVVVTKTNTYATTIYAIGYSSCSATDPRRIERALKINY